MKVATNCEMMYDDNRDMFLNIANSPARRRQEKMNHVTKREPKQENHIFFYTMIMFFGTVVSAAVVYLAAIFSLLVF